MKKTTRIISIIAILASFMFAGISSAYANGFFIQEMSAAGLAQGEAVIAAGDRPSTQYQNPANLAYIPGISFELSGTIYIPTGYYENPQGERTNQKGSPQFVPHMFASWKINEWAAVGLAGFVDFGLAVEWPDDWEGSHIVTTASMNSFTINPNVAFGPFHGFSIAVGFDAKWGAVDIKRNLTLGMVPYGDENGVGRVHLAGEAWGFGGNIGIMYQPFDWWRMGASYRSGFKMDLDEGKADFDVPAPWAARFPDQNFKASISLPHLVNFGTRFWPMEKLSIELDFWYTMWSSYDILKFEFSKGLAMGPNKNETIQQEIKSYEDAIQLRIGAEYKFYDDHFAVRAGFLWDQNPAPDDTVDPMLPDSERVMPCIGFGTEWYGFFFDIGYMAVFALPRDLSDSKENPFPGKYSAIVHDVTFTIGYNFEIGGNDEIQEPENDESPIKEPVPEEEIPAEPAPVENAEAVEAAPATEASAPVEAAPADAPVEKVVAE